MPMGVNLDARTASRARAGLAALVLLLAAAAPARAAAPDPGERTLVFFGDSLTEGYGLADPSTESFPALVQRRIASEGLPWRVVNAGLSGETSAGGLRRIDWVLRQRVDLLVLELGANDGLRGTAPDVTFENLQAIVDRVRARFPEARIVIAGMRMPGSMGPDYAEAFHRVFTSLASRNSLVLIPFLLEGVAGKPALNQADNLHPTAQGETIIAETVWKAVRPLLGPEEDAGPGTDRGP